MITNNINHVYSTVSNGRTHIACDKNYVGSVNSYNNFFTKFFARIFHRSIQVNFDGKIRIVNKRSYFKLLKNLGYTEVTLNNTGQFTTVFKQVAERSNLPTGRWMRDAISSEKRISLFRKLAVAISKNQTDKALKLVGKGAELDIEYFDRGSYGPSFESISDGLRDDRPYNFNAYKGTLILEAKSRHNIPVVEMLKEFGANQEVKAKECFYKTKGRPTPPKPNSLFKDNWENADTFH